MLCPLGWDSKSKNIYSLMFHHYGNYSQENNGKKFHLPQRAREHFLSSPLRHSAGKVDGKKATAALHCHYNLFICENLMRQTFQRRRLR
jgi:hypothetical protein